tara:strand:+ start:52 stop:276 length:225 start_codon:yes stop_codon:yes gene_type:complete
MPFNSNGMKKAPVRGVQDLINEINKIKKQRREIFTYPDQNLIEENLLMMEKYIEETKDLQSWGEIEISETFSEE